MLDEGLTSDEQVFVGNANGDAKQGLAGAARTIEAVYAYPYQNHATMEPMNATAVWTAERCEVWCPTQNGEAALEAAAEAAGLPITQCDVHKIHLGGGFGRRGAFHDFVTQAVSIAKQLPGTPVKLLWTREEDMAHGHYHPITKCKLVGGLTDNGDLSALHVRISGQSILASVRPNGMAGDGADPVTFQGFQAEGDHAISYSVPNLLVEHAMRNPPVPPGFWRGVNINQNAIYLECFIDELAHAAGKDPLEFRRMLMAEHPKSLAVLEVVADKAGWGTPAGDGIHRGLAVTKTFGSHVAACAEVSVDKGKVRVHRIVAATDPGYAVNPQQIEAQVEGSFVYGLSALLYGECTLQNGAVVQSNFHDYPSMLLRDMPKVEVIVMPSGGFWGGIGEPTIAVAAPAVLNAIFAATGKRIRSIPLKDLDLS
jgi:isoquinoline 1-oxidoreductase beta subunit